MNVRKGLAFFNSKSTFHCECTLKAESIYWNIYGTFHFIQNLIEHYVGKQ